MIERFVENRFRIGITLVGIAFAFSLFFGCARQDLEIRKQLLQEIAVKNEGPHPWQSFRNNYSNTGVAEVELRPALTAYSGRNKWRFDCEGLIWSTPVADENGVAYLGSTSGYFYAVNPDGTLKWKYKLFDKLNAIIDSAAVIGPGGMIYAPGGDSHIHALDRETGKRKWAFEAKAAYLERKETTDIRNSFEGNVTIGPNGWVYAVSNNGLLYALDPDTGEEKWSFETIGKQFLWSLPAFSPDNAFCVFGSLDRYLYLVDPVKGKGLDAYKMPGEVKSSPMVLGDRVFVGASANRFVALRVVNTQNGLKLKKIWTFKTGGQVYSSPALCDDKVVFGSEDGFVYAVSFDGELVWKYQARSKILGSPLVSKDNIVVVGTGSGELFAIDGNTGRRMWSIHLPERYNKANLDASPAVTSDRRILAGSFDGYLYSVPFEYCAQHADDPGIDTSPDDDIPEFAENPDVTDGFFLRYLDPENGYPLSKPERPVSTGDVLRFRFVKMKDNLPVMNAGVAVGGMELEITPPADAEAVVSTDSYYLDIRPHTFWKPGTTYQVTVRGKTFNRSNLIWDFVKRAFARPFEYKFSFSTAPIESKGLETMDRRAAEGKWTMSSIFILSPRILDSLVTAAVTGQDFILTTVYSDPERDRFVLLVNHATRTSAGSEPIPKPDKVFFMTGSYDDESLRFRGSFPFMAMGSGAYLQDFTATGELDEQNNIAHGFFMGQTPCSAMKSNDADYAPSWNVIDDLCDDRFDFKVLGQYDGPKTETRDKKPSFDVRADRIDRNEAVLRVTRTGGDTQAALLSLLLIDPENVEVVDHRKQVVKDEKTVSFDLSDLSFQGSLVAVVCLNDRVVFKKKL